MVAYSNCMEVGIMGAEAEKWTQWILDDSSRAELPLSIKKQDTLPIGFAFDVGSIEPVPWGESFLPPAPFLYVLSTHGIMCCFRVINVRANIASICTPPEHLPDAGGLSQFTNMQVNVLHARTSVLNSSVYGNTVR